MANRGILVVVSGFSGAGKGTLMKHLLEKYDNYALSISATTRAPREGEEYGREYFFHTKQEFEELILQYSGSGKDPPEERKSKIKKLNGWSDRAARENICYNINSGCPIDLALIWRNTKQGHEYWRKINDIVINELSK